MTIELSKLYRTRIQSEAVFGVDDSATPANYVDFPASEGAMVGTAQEMLEAGLQEQYRLGRQKRVAGVRSASLNLPFNLVATGAANPGNVAFPTTATWGLARLLKAMMGGMRTPSVQGAITQALVGSTASSINVTAGHGNTLGAVGGAFGVYIASSGKIECREILSVASGVVVPKVAFSAAPATNAAVYWPAATFYFTEDPAESLQFLCEGAETTDRFCVGGLQGTLAIETSVAALAKATASLTGPYWAKLSSVALAAATVANYAPVPVIDSECILGTGTITACQTRNAIDWSSASYTIGGIAFDDVRSPNGVQTVLRKRGSRAVGMSAALTTYYNQSTYDFWTAHSGRTDLSLFQQIGSVVGGMILISMPTVQVMCPARADANGMTGLTLQFEGRNDEATATATEIGRSCGRIDIF